MSSLLRVILVLILLASAAESPAASQVIITEFMASNSRTLVDEDGSFEDWIEIFNAGASTVNLLDWSLTDAPGNLNKWRFPATNLAAELRQIRVCRHSLLSGLPDSFCDYAKTRLGLRWSGYARGDLD